MSVHDSGSVLGGVIAENGLLANWLQLISEKMFEMFELILEHPKVPVHPAECCQLRIVGLLVINSILKARLLLNLFPE